MPVSGLFSRPMVFHFDATKTLLLARCAKSVAMKSRPKTLSQ